MLAAALAVGPAAAAPAQPPELKIENAAIRLLVIPEARRDLAVTISGGTGTPVPKVTRQGANVAIDGGLAAGGEVFGFRFGGVSCREGEVNLPGKGWTAVKDLPLVTVHAPIDPRLSVSGAAFGEVGPSRSLALSSTGCGAWKAGAVSGDAAVHLVGSPSLAMASVGKGLQAELTGQSKLTATEANGPLKLASTGSARIEIARGRAPSADLQLTGSGGISYGGEVGTLNTAVAGSGNIRVAMVFGMATSSTRGSGAAYVGRPKDAKLCPPNCS
jgi:hypothetical protein